MTPDPVLVAAIAASLTSRYGFAQVVEALKPKPPVFTPFPGPQTEAFHTQADELYYGGAAGGGKSMLVCGLSLSEHRNTLILRRRKTDTKALASTLKRFRHGRWASSGHGGTLRLPNGGEIEVGGCQRPDDWEKYAGHANDFIAFDELPQFTEEMYTTLIGWNRVRFPDEFPRQRCRVVGAGNPPTNAAGEWVIRRWAPWLDPQHPNKAKPGELRWFAMIDNRDTEVPGPDPVTHKGEVLRPKSRTFIPAKLEDNPVLAATDYGARLDAFPEPLRSMLRSGRFDTARTDDRWQLIPTAWVKAANARWLLHRNDPLPKLDRIGMDVAMSANPGDQTVIARLHGVTIAELDACPGSETQTGMAALNRLLGHLALNPDAVVNIDANGAGRSCYDCSQERKMRNVKDHVGSRTPGNYRDPKSRTLKFVNLRAAVWWNLRCMLNPEIGTEDDRLRLPPDPQLLTDLTAPRYFYQPGDKILVESKESFSEGGGLRARLGYSPDKGDAVALACWKPQGPVFHSA